MPTKPGHQSLLAAQEECHSTGKSRGMHARPDHTAHSRLLLQDSNQQLGCINTAARRGAKKVATAPM
jgi:hypothetical protein